MLSPTQLGAMIATALLNLAGHTDRAAVLNAAVSSIESSASVHTAQTLDLVDRLEDDGLLSWWKPLLAALAPALLANYRFEGVEGPDGQPAVFRYRNLETGEHLNLGKNGQSSNWVNPEQRCFDAAQKGRK